MARARIVDVRPHTEGKVRRQRPWGCSPCQNTCVFITQLEGNGYGWVLHILIIRGGFKVRQHGAQRRGHGHHLQALVNIPLVPELLNHPPDTLHKRGVHRFVVVIKIYPATQPGNSGLPLVNVAINNTPAFIVVTGDAKLLHGILSGQPKLLINLMLDRQTMTIPTEPAHDIAPLHRPVARHNVLDSAGNQMSVVRQTRREGRSIVEDIGLLILSILQALLKHILALPELKNRVLHCHKGKAFACWCGIRNRRI